MRVGTAASVAPYEAYGSPKRRHSYENADCGVPRSMLASRPRNALILVAEKRWLYGQGLAAPHLYPVTTLGSKQARVWPNRNFTSMRLSLLLALQHVQQTRHQNIQLDISQRQNRVQNASPRILSELATLSSECRHHSQQNARH